MKPLLCSLLIMLTFTNAENGLLKVSLKNDAAFNKSDISFISNGLAVKGWLFLPENANAAKLPAIVMAPGFSGVKECNYQHFAARFAEEGFAVLLFDYPNFGASAVHIKNEVDPWQQVQAYRDGITFLETRDEIDPKRIGVWGGSYSGGHALVVSALDSRVKCVVAMTPFISGSFYVKNFKPEVKAFLTQQFNTDRLARVNGGNPATIPVATGDGKQFSAISSPNAWKFIESFKEAAPAYENKVTLKSLEMQLEYEPGYYVQNIGSIPKLFIIAKGDELVPEQLIKDAFNTAAEPKKLEYIDGHHFSPYMESLPEAAKQAAEWFKANL